MNLKESCLYDTDEALAEQLLDSEHPSLSGITLKGLRDKGWMRLPQTVHTLCRWVPDSIGET